MRHNTNMSKGFYQDIAIHINEKSEIIIGWHGPWSICFKQRVLRINVYWRDFCKKYAKCGSKLNLKLISTGIWFLWFLIS